MKIVIRNYLIWLVCLSFMAGITHGSSGGVLCLGDDGHVMVVSLCQPSCGDSRSKGLTEQSDDAHNHHDGCSNCIDLPLIRELFTQRAPEPIVNADSYSVNSIATSPAPQAGGVTSPVSPPLLEIQTAFGESVFLSTTVLRC